MITDLNFDIFKAKIDAMVVDELRKRRPRILIGRDGLNIFVAVGNTGLMVSQKVINSPPRDVYDYGLIGNFYRSTPKEIVLIEEPMRKYDIKISSGLSDTVMNNISEVNFDGTNYVGRNIGIINCSSIDLFDYQRGLAEKNIFLYRENLTKYTKKTRGEIDRMIDTTTKIHITINRDIWNSTPACAFNRVAGTHLFHISCFNDRDTTRIFFIYDETENNIHSALNHYYPDANIRVEKEGNSLPLGSVIYESGITRSHPHVGRPVVRGDESDDDYNDRDIESDDGPDILNKRNITRIFGSDPEISADSENGHFFVADKPYKVGRGAIMQYADRLHRIDHIKLIKQQIKNERDPPNVSLLKGYWYNCIVASKKYDDKGTIFDLICKFTNLLYIIKINRPLTEDDNEVRTLYVLDGMSHYIKNVLFKDEYHKLSVLSDSIKKINEKLHGEMEMKRSLEHAKSDYERQIDENNDEIKTNAARLLDHIKIIIYQNILSIERISLRMKQDGPIVSIHKLIDKNIKDINKKKEIIISEEKKRAEIMNKNRDNFSSNMSYFTTFIEKINDFYNNLETIKNNSDKKKTELGLKTTYFDEYIFSILKIYISKSLRIDLALLSRSLNNYEINQHEKECMILKNLINVYIKHIFSTLNELFIRFGTLMNSHIILFNDNLPEFDGKLFESNDMFIPRENIPVPHNETKSTRRIEQFVDMMYETRRKNMNSNDLVNMYRNIRTYYDWSQQIHERTNSASFEYFTRLNEILKEMFRQINIFNVRTNCDLNEADLSEIAKKIKRHETDIEIMQQINSEKTLKLDEINKNRLEITRMRDFNESLSEVKIQFDNTHVLQSDMLQHEINDLENKSVVLQSKISEYPHLRAGLHEIVDLIKLINRTKRVQFDKIKNKESIDAIIIDTEKNVSKMEEDKNILSTKGKPIMDNLITDILLANQNVDEYIKRIICILHSIGAINNSLINNSLINNSLINMMRNSESQRLERHEKGEKKERVEPDKTLITLTNRRIMARIGRNRHDILKEIDECKEKLTR